MKVLDNSFTIQRGMVLNILMNINYKKNKKTLNLYYVNLNIKIFTCLKLITLITISLEKLKIIKSKLFQF